MDVFESEDLVVLNDGSPTYFNGHHSSSIDVSAASRCFSGNLRWSVNPDLCGSDHYPVQISFLSGAAFPATTRRPRWRFENADWSVYDNYVRSQLRSQTSWNIPDFSNVIIDAAKAAIPRTSCTPGRKALRWWSEDTKHAVKARRKALRKLKKLPLGHPHREDALTRYRELHNLCRQVIRDAKRTSWESFLESINASQTSAHLWNRVNALSGHRRSAPLTLIVEETSVSDPTVVAETLGNYFASLAAIDSYDHLFKSKYQPSTETIRNFVIPTGGAYTELDKPFSFRELAHALRCSNGKSAGPDDIGYPLLKNLPTTGKTILLSMYNRLWLGNSFPPSWRESLVVPIPKTNTPTKDPTHFRPIALTCCIGKI